MTQSSNNVFRCDKCGTPIFRIVGNTIVVEAKHHGEKHVSVIPISQIAGEIPRFMPADKLNPVYLARERDPPP